MSDVVAMCNNCNASIAIYVRAHVVRRDERKVVPFASVSVRSVPCLEYHPITVMLKKTCVGAGARCSHLIAQEDFEAIVDRLINVLLLDT